MKDTSDKRELLQERRWECGWDEHESLQRQRLSNLSLSEKLIWLEQAQRTATHLQASRSSASAQPDSSGD